MTIEYAVISGGCFWCTEAIFKEVIGVKSVESGYTGGTAENPTYELETKWGEKYPIVLESWRSKWELLSAYFRYPKAIRKPIYTTNAVEAVHRQFRKLTIKPKGLFLMKTAY